ncbi:hypothetical protein YC2023_045391 [Brassica napus]
MLSCLYYFGPLFLRHSGCVSEGWFGDHDCTLACVGLHLQSAIGAAYTSRRVCSLHAPTGYPDIWAITSLFGFFGEIYVQLANGLKAHPPTIIRQKYLGMSYVFLSVKEVWKWEAEGCI